MRHLILCGILLISLSGCTSTTWWPDIDSEEKCNEERDLTLTEKRVKWGAEGHVSTTNIIALTAGQQNLAEKFALYSQVPDSQALRFSAPAVSLWGVFYWDYRENINAILHSLHGGDEQKIIQRREKLTQLINQLVRDNPVKNVWEIGFLIHALGDTYAHVYDEGNGLYAYGPLIGHLWEKGSFSPDSIYENQENYLAFLKNLFDALNIGNGDTETFDRYIAHIKAVIKKASKLSESKRDQYIRNEIVIFELDNVPPLHYCEHVKWTDEVTFTNVNSFLNKVKNNL